MGRYLLNDSKIYPTGIWSIAPIQKPITLKNITIRQYILTGIGIGFITIGLNWPGFFYNIPFDILESKSTDFLSIILPTYLPVIPILITQLCLILYIYNRFKGYYIGDTKRDYDGIFKRKIKCINKRELTIDHLIVISAALMIVFISILYLYYIFGIILFTLAYYRSKWALYKRFEWREEFKKNFPTDKLFAYDICNRKYIKLNNKVKKGLRKFMFSNQIWIIFFSLALKLSIISTYLPISFEIYNYELIYSGFYISIIISLVPLFIRSYLEEYRSKIDEAGKKIKR